jgi:AcrR family transcriptional regulator
VLRAAFGVFRKRGFSGASTLEIATRAKVSKRDLHVPFGSKRNADRVHQGSRRLFTHQQRHDRARKK